MGQIHVVFGAGQVGALLAERLIAAGRQVRVVRRSVGPVAVGAERIPGDATDREFCVRAAAGAAAALHNVAAAFGRQLPRVGASSIEAHARLFNYPTENNFWTFADRSNKDKFHLKGLKLNIVFLIALGVSYLTFVSLSLLFPNIMPQIHQASGIIPATVVNYLLNSYRTFKSTDKIRQPK